MTAEPQPRHPLALLASIKEAVEGVRELVNGMNAPDAQRGMQDSAFDTLGFTLCDLENLESALRAQAEAEAGLREALAYYADFDGEHVRALGQYFVRRQTLDREFVWRADRGQTARAALAQAGGES